MKDSKAKELTKFLKENKTDKLILAGDIIDGWALKRKFKWKKKHTECLNEIIKLSLKKDVYWLRGNHDDFLKDFIPITLGKIHLQENYILESNNKKLLILHGDIFDIFATKLKFIAKIGSLLYDFALFINRKYNWWRKLRGKNYFSISQKLKENVKFAVNFINNFEKFIVDICNKEKLDGVICGHIHHPQIKTIENKIYMNSGDWIENMSALCEDFNGNWKIVYFK
jgi:UDP-2,3-diacylglucosamine pyrophosphatase LpxH